MDPGLVGERVRIIMDEKNSADGSRHEAAAGWRVDIDKVIFAVVMALVTGFSIGSALTVFTTRENAGTFKPFGPNAKERAVRLDEKIRRASALAERSPDNVPVLIDLGNSCLDSGRFQDAIDAYTRALSIEPKNADVRNDLGIVYREIGRYDKAVESFRQAAEDSPLHARSWYNLGVVLACDMGNNREAVDAWEEFLARGPCTHHDDLRTKMVRSEVERMKRDIFEGVQFVDTK